VATFANATALETSGDTLTGVVVRQSGDPAQGSQRARETVVRTRRVVNACGAWSPEIARMVGVALPNKPHRHEICSTEPTKPWLTPLIADLSNGLYFSQSMRGEIVGGLSQKEAPKGINQESSVAFLARYARALTMTCPMTSDLKVLRQWAGCYDVTPDGHPIFGPVDAIEGFFQASGFMGNGFMLAPVVSKILARHIVKGESHPTLEQWNLRRSQEGNLLSEAMFIG